MLKDERSTRRAEVRFIAGQTPVQVRQSGQAGHIEIGTDNHQDSGSRISESAVDRLALHALLKRAKTMVADV